MTKRTLSNKTRSSILKVPGFRARMANNKGKKIHLNFFWVCALTKYFVLAFLQATYNLYFLSNFPINFPCVKFP